MFGLELHSRTFVWRCRKQLSAKEDQSTHLESSLDSTRGYPFRIRQFVHFDHSPPAYLPFCLSVICLLVYKSKTSFHLAVGLHELASHPTRPIMDSRLMELHFANILLSTFHLCLIAIKANGHLVRASNSDFTNRVYASHL